MTTIIILIIAIAMVLGVFIYLRLREDEKKFKHIIDKIKKNPIVVDQEIRVQTDLFIQGLNKVDFTHTDFKEVKQELHKKIIGMDDFINAIIINILCGGHVLVEGVPGLAKTKTISTFSEVMGMDFKRIQFTPDMLPSDIVGVDIFNSKTREFETKLGPIVANIILADEINRATPKVQSALLESMQEKQVTISGNTFKLPEPFLVLATQNPLEQEGTYPLPEAQIDRFLFKVLVSYPTQKQEMQVLQTMEDEQHIHIKKIISHTKFHVMQQELQKVVIDESIKTYITKLIQKTREKHPDLLYGASPRGSLGLMIASKALAFIEGRAYVKYEDVQRVAFAVLRHRIVLTYDAKIEGITEDEILLDILSKVSLV